MSFGTATGATNSHASPSPADHPELSGSDDRYLDARGVLAERRQQFEVFTVTGDDLDVDVRSTGVGERGDNRIDPRRSRICAPTNRLLTKRPSGVPEVRIDTGDDDELEKASHVEVMTRVSGQHAFREDSGGKKEVRRSRSQYAQPSAPLLIDWREPDDTSGVEDDDQPAALRTFAVFRAGRAARVVRLARGRTALAEAAHASAAAIALAEGGPCSESSSSSQASSRAILD